MTMARWYSVGVEAATPPLTLEQVDGLLNAIEHLGGEGPSVSGGPPVRGAGAQVSVLTHDSVEASRMAVELFEKAAAQAGVHLEEIEHVDVMTEEFQHRALFEEEPESFLGVTEIGKVLGVTKQRISQLRSLPGFPEPAAELAAGPIWRASTLKRFIEEWPRKPGRPSRPRKNLQDIARDTRRRGRWPSGPRRGA